MPDHYESTFGKDPMGWTGSAPSPRRQELFERKNGKLELRPKHRRRNFLSLLGAIVLSVIAGLLIGFCLFIVWATSQGPRETQRLVPAAEKVRIDGLLKKHGLSGQISVIEITPADGTLWFERDGRPARFR